MKLSYFILSGEHAGLAYSELKSVLSLAGFGGVEIQLLDGRVAVAEVPPSIHDMVCGRTAYTRSSGILLSLQPYEVVGKPSITIPEEVLMDVISYPTTFRAEAMKLSGARGNTMELEAALADSLIAASGKLSVSLDNPARIFQCIVTPNCLLAGMMLSQKAPHLFTSRRAGLRPFKLPTAIQPKLARCMVNLAVTTLDSTVYDPFAGVGSILIEASLLGHLAVGTELKTWIAEGMLRNLRQYVQGLEMPIQADARKPPFRSYFDAIVTDPPYGRSSTIPGKSLSLLLTDFLTQVGTVLDRGGRICMTLPLEPSQILEARDYGLRILELHKIYVHKALTRYLVVLTH